MLILDASVAAKLFIAEADSDQAEQVLALGEPLIAPDLVLVEVANALHKAWRREIVDDVQMDRACCASCRRSSGACSRPPISLRTPRSSRASCDTQFRTASTLRCTGERVRRSLQPTWSLSKPPMPCRLGPAARFA